MKLISIRLNNFRQFYGKTPEIYLASGERNTTIIHGNNGAGKTTILNAFTWVLYEKFTAAFALPECLINKRAIAEVAPGTSVAFWVEIYFEHDNKRYHLKRQCYATQGQNGEIDYGETKLHMLIGGDDGCWNHPRQQPEDIINQVLPESLHKYFFFDGERIENIFRSRDQSKIAEDTKELIGVKVLERAIEHLKNAKKVLQEELLALGDSSLHQIVKQQQNLEEQRETLTLKQAEIKQKVTQQEQLKQVLSQRLLELGGAEDLKRLKMRLEQQENQLREQLVKSKKKLKQLISTQSYLVFLDEQFKGFQNLMINLRQKGELPRGIKQQFVQQLLARKKCICGNELPEGSLPHQEVQDWMNRAGEADLEESTIRLESQVNNLQKQVGGFWVEADLEQANISQWRSELAQVENELDDIKSKFRCYPDQDIKELQVQLDQVESTLKELILEQGINKQQLETLFKAIETTTKKIEKQKIQEEKQNLAQRRITATQEAINRITEMKKSSEYRFRQSLEKKVQEIFSEISFTPYVPRITEGYELDLVEKTSGVTLAVAASTGEYQILSLSFIGGIIDRVREWSSQENLMALDSSTFPIVMDSPFGSLDEIYRRHVASLIPKIANQLVILVTKTQWRGEVETEIASKIGREYVLVYYSPKADCEEDAINRYGTTYPLVSHSTNGFEYTEVVEILINR